MLYVEHYLKFNYIYASLIDPVEFQMVQDKMQASFNNINTDLLFISSIVIILCIGYAYDYLKILDVMSLGRDAAINLGIDYDKIVKKNAYNSSNINISSNSISWTNNFFRATCSKYSKTSNI